MRGRKRHWKKRYRGTRKARAKQRRRRREVMRRWWLRCPGAWRGCVVGPIHMPPDFYNCLLGIDYGIDGGAVVTMGRFDASMQTMIVDDIWEVRK